MQARIIRAVTRPSALPDARAKQPRLNVAACPHASPGMLCIALRLIIFALWVLRPIQREPVAYQPIRKVNAINRTYRNRAPVLVHVHGRAINRPSSYEGVKVVRCLGPAPILQAVIIAIGPPIFKDLQDRLI